MENASDTFCKKYLNVNNTNETDLSKIHSLSARQKQHDQ
jgi:hypothetical protein